MKKFGALMVTAALATTTAWAQMNDGTNKPVDQGQAGVVTGQSADGGIALRTDAKRANGTAPAISGGVSLNARDTLRGSESNANVKLVFALNTGNYVSDVQVRVMDKTGRTVIEDTSNGPWLLARLPAGAYTAQATYNGNTVTQKFSVGAKGMRTAQFRWPASVEQQSVGAADSQAGGSILGTGPEEPRR